MSWMIWLALGIGLSIGGAIGVFLMALVGGSEKEYPKYRHWKGKTYELLTEDALDADNLDHLVIYRACYGRRIIWVRKKSDFFGKVVNRHNEEMERFERID